MTPLLKSLLKLGGDLKLVSSEPEKKVEQEAKAVPFTPLTELAKEAMIRELKSINALTDWQLSKLAELSSMTATEAQNALRRLRDLDRSKPTPGQLARGAGVGAVAGPIAGVISDVITGAKGKTKMDRLRGLLARSVTGATFGGAIPYARHHLEHAVTEQQLKDYLGHSRPGELRSKIRRTIGV